MKKTIEIGLVVTLTIISVITMVQIKGSDINEESVFIEDGEEDNGKPDGTGYMFDDFDKGINIPFEEKKEKPETEKDNTSSQLEQNQFKRTLERNMAMLKDESTSYGIAEKTNTVTNNTENIRSKSKDIISKVQNNISFEEKLYLLNVVKRLSLSELNDIRKAIMNGTTNAESIKLWTMLRNKLPKDEYKKLENIIVKYE